MKSLIILQAQKLRKTWMCCFASVDLVYIHLLLLPASFRLFKAKKTAYSIFHGIVFVMHIFLRREHMPRCSNLSINLLQQNHVQITNSGDLVFLSGCSGAN